MNLLNCLNFVVSVCGYLAGSSLFNIVLLGVFAMFLVIIIIRLVWYLVQFN